MHFIIHFSILPKNRANRDFPLTATIFNNWIIVFVGGGPLKRTPGISPTECPFLPNPDTVTSSFSFKKLRQPSLGTKAEIFFPFFLRRTLTHLRTAELGCLDSLYRNLVYFIFITLLSFQQLIPWHGKLLRRDFYI